MPTIDIPDKICPHCGGIRWRIEYRKRPTKTDPNKRIIRYRCSTRAIERGRRWIENHPEEYKEYHKLKSRNRRAEGYYKKPNVRNYARLKAKKESEELAPNFLKNTIMKSVNTKGAKYISRADIPQEMIETKRKQLLLMRQTKNYANNTST